jgi:hypothetical protein
VGVEVEEEAPEGFLLEVPQLSRRSTSRRSGCRHGRPLAPGAGVDPTQGAWRSAHDMSGDDESRSYIGTSASIVAFGGPWPRTGTRASDSTSPAGLQFEAQSAASGRLWGPMQQFRRSRARLRRQLRTGRQPSTGGTIRRVSDARNRQLAKCVHNFVQKLGRTDEPSLLNLRQPVSKTIAFRPKPWKCRQTRSLQLAQDDAGTRRKSAGNLAKPLQICVLRTAGSRAQSREPRKLRDLPELSFVWYCSTLPLSPARSRPRKVGVSGSRCCPCFLDRARRMWEASWQGRSASSPRCLARS